MTTTYTFGDGDRAARRLRDLADAYQSTSAALLKRFAGAMPALAVDMGAGLGFTTRLVHAQTGAAATVGLDASERFVTAAASTAPAGVTYAVHDVTQTPFPCAAPHFVYARFLLTHLSDPVAALAAWREASAPRALLVLEETAELASEHPALRRYYEVVEAMQRHHGQELRIGRTLAALADRAGWRVVDERLMPVPLSPSRMARLHVENLRTWRDDPFVVARFDASELDALDRALEGVAQGGDDDASVVVAMGQVVATR